MICQHPGESGVGLALTRWLAEIDDEIGSHRLDQGTAPAPGFYSDGDAHPMRLLRARARGLCPGLVELFGCR